MMLAIVCPYINIVHFRGGALGILSRPIIITAGARAAPVDRVSPPMRVLSSKSTYAGQNVSYHLIFMGWAVYSNMSHFKSILLTVYNRYEFIPLLKHCTHTVADS